MPVQPPLRRTLRAHTRATHALDERSHPFQLGSAQEAAFGELQQLLQSPPVLAHFDENAATEMHMDANYISSGAVLFQKHSGGENVIAYASRGLSKKEKKLRSF